LGSSICCGARNIFKGLILSFKSPLKIRLACLILLALPGLGRAAYLTVCASGCTNTTLTAAIAAAVSGDTIVLMGDINESVNYATNKALTLTGDGNRNRTFDGNGVVNNDTLTIGNSAKSRS